MAVFTYEAVGSGGRRVRGLLRADTARQARDALRGRGLAVWDLGVFTGNGTSIWSRLAVVRRARLRHNDQPGPRRLPFGPLSPSGKGMG